MGVAAVAALVAEDRRHMLAYIVRVVLAMDLHREQCLASLNTAWMASLRGRLIGAHDLGYFAILTSVNFHPCLRDFESQIPEMGFHPCNLMPVLIGPLLLVLIYPLLVQGLLANLLRLRLPFRDACLPWLAATDSSVAR